MSEGPYLVIAAFWQHADNTDEVAEAVSQAKFPAPKGWPRGCVVAFRREVATLPAFKRDLRRFDLAELIPRPREADVGDARPDGNYRSDWPR